MSPRIVDLRSDTVTRPTPEMLREMAEAEVGDDVIQEDPTVNRLQELAAEKMGKEAGLFIASGTMGNLLAVLAHATRGDEAILGNLSHTFLFEGGGMAALAGVSPYPLPNQGDGTLRLEDIRAAIRSKGNPHYPISRLLILENTHNRCGGSPLSVDYTRQAGALARENGLSFHIDGARIFNAAVAMGVSALELAQPADSITFCLSKGLCAPVGSVLCGSADFITRARRFRKVLGGGWRQAGVLAAAGIVALEKMSGRLGEDHTRAKTLAKGLAEIPALELLYPDPPSNMVFARITESSHLSAPALAEALEKLDVKINVVDKHRFRLVTHYWVDDAGIEQALDGFSRLLK
ncbi:MAG: low-specificity L-threonine aldolase [Anaerolineaceae bacterium]|nr:low-specificity L-threonine aldolase [Anaerolineaceae bacterium]